MTTNYVQFIRIYWATRNCQNAQYRASNRAMLRHFLNKERERRAALNHRTAWTCSRC